MAILSWGCTPKRNKALLTWLIFFTYSSEEIGVHVLLYLKIASYYGFDLEIESDIVPKELIDNTPAREYPEPYEFYEKV